MLNIIYTMNLGDKDFRITKEIENAIREADKFVEEKTGNQITDFFYDVAANNDWYLYDVEERRKMAHCSDEEFDASFDDYEYDYDEANEIISGVIWGEAENYVNFNIYGAH